MRNFYDQPTNKIFNKMFGKQARQIQADPTLDLTKCNCCRCDPIACKGCIEGHVISQEVGCCHGKNHGLIFEYERPNYYGGGMQCCPVPPEPCCPNSGLLDQNQGGVSDINPFPPSFPPTIPSTLPTIPFPPTISEPPNIPDIIGGDGCEGLPPCNSYTPYVKKCCGTGKQSASDVRFYYNYIGQYYNIDFNCTGKYSKWPKNGLPRLCSWCDPSSLEEALDGEPAFGFGDETCLDYLPLSPAIDPRVDEQYPPNPTTATEYPCSAKNSENQFNECNCIGYGDLKDPARGQSTTTFTSKRLSNYKKRQMEQNPQYRWLLDIMCYDQGNVVLAPYHEYILTGEARGDGDEVQAQAIPKNGGTLYNHLIGVVHCEHWYEIARCPQNPEHGDPNGVLGGWIVDSDGEVVGANPANIAPRFWVYACSGVPLFDFEVQRAMKEFDEFGNPFISVSDYEHIVKQFAQQRTPKQEVMNKLAKAGCFDLGDWRQEALNEIRILRGLSHTADAYGDIQGYTGDEGACCFGASGDMNSSCMFMKGVSCGICGGDFFLGKRCTSDLCVNCSGFKPHFLSSSYSKYLGPVRKKMHVLFEPLEQNFGINYEGITRPAFLDPRKARRNTPNAMSQIPPLAEGRERNFVTNPDPTLVNLQLPPDLLPMPWGNFTDPNFFRNGGTLPESPLPGEAQSKEYKEFKIWLNSQWLYMHAKPGGWDYVCSAFQGDGTQGSPVIEDPRIPNLPRKFSVNCPALGCCLDGLKGWPQRTFQFDGGCPDNISCGYINSSGQQIEAPIVGCEGPACFGLECNDSYELCVNHPEQGGGKAPCRSIAFSSGCNGMRFIYYRHKQIAGSDLGGPGDYTTCDGYVQSYLYRVNIDTGNYGDFCPHACRTLSVPRRISESLPLIFSNRVAAGSLCQQYANEDFRGIMCPGLYCLSNYIDIQGPPYYGPAFSSQNFCCGGRRNSGPVSGFIPTDPTHLASSKSLCPLYPGPPCLTPGCDFYDGKFVGRYLDSNPRGCCWKCGLNDQGNPIPIEFKGGKEFFECEQEQTDEIRQYDGFVSTGRGFIPFNQIGSETSQCIQQWAGECACGTNTPGNNPPYLTEQLCSPPGLSGDDDPNGEQGGY